MRLEVLFIENQQPNLPIADHHTYSELTETPLFSYFF